MAPRRQKQAEGTLGLDDDLDDVEMLRAIEQSFGVTFEAPVSWATVGDAYEALLARIPVAADGGRKCATTMAFYRLRRGLRDVLGTDVPIGPKTRLRDLTRRPTKRVLRELSAAIALPMWGFTLSWLGGVGLLLCLAGLVGGFVSLPLGSLFLLGLAVVRFDPGSFGTQTVGDMARSLAAHNYSAFAADGADLRPAAIWSALVELLGEVAEMNPAQIGPQTRLLA